MAQEFLEEKKETYEGLVIKTLEEAVLSVLNRIAYEQDTLKAAQALSLVCETLSGRR